MATPQPVTQFHRPLPSLLSVGLIGARWPRPHGHYSQVVGGDVAPLPTSCLHQAPLGVPSLVVRLQDTNRIAGLDRDFVVSSRREVVGCKHLERRESWGSESG